VVGRDEAALDAEREAVGAPEPEEVGGDGRELPQHHVDPRGLAGVSSGLLILFSGAAWPTSGGGGRGRAGEGFTTAAAESLEQRGGGPDLVKRGRGGGRGRSRT